MRLGGPEWEESPDRTNPLGGFVRAGAAPLAGCAARPPWRVVQAHGVLDAKARLIPNLVVTRTPAVEATEGGTNPSCTVVESHERDVLT